MSGCPIEMPVWTPNHDERHKGPLTTSMERPRAMPKASQSRKSKSHVYFQPGKMTAPNSGNGGRRRPRDQQHQPPPSFDSNNSTPSTSAISAHLPRPQNRNNPRLLLAVTTLTLGCAILFLPSLSLNSRANRRLSVQTQAEESVDGTLHSSSIRTARDRMRNAAANAIESANGGKASSVQRHRSLQRSSNGDGIYQADTSPNIPNEATTAPPKAPNPVAGTHRARSAASGRKLVSTSAAENHLGDHADGAGGRRLGLGSTLSDAASSAGLPDAVVGTIGNVVSQLASMTSSAASTVSNGVRNIGRERQLAEVWDAPTLYDTPTFWHVPKAGGTTVIRYYATCRHLVEARGGKADSSPAVTVTENMEGNKFVNVDTSSPDGLRRARAMGLAQSGLADMVIAQNLHETADLYTPEYRGRFFALFRHPIDRAVSLFYYRQVAHWEPTYNPSLKQVSLEEYANTHGGEKNWMVRMLVNKENGGSLDRSDLEIAKEVLRRKFVVGLMDNMAESLERFDRYFGWYDPTNVEAMECMDQLTSKKGAVNSNKHASVEEGSPAWEGLARHNELDLELYDYVLELWEAQRHILDMQGDGSQTPSDAIATE